MQQSAQVGERLVQLFVRRTPVRVFVGLRIAVECDHRHLHIVQMVMRQEHADAEKMFVPLFQKGAAHGVRLRRNDIAALRRGGELRGEGCVAIKRFKPKQDERVDLPSIGLQTVRLLIEQHYRCLAVDAGKTLFFDRAEALALADKHNFCIIALTEDSFGKLRLQAKAD